MITAMLLMLLQSSVPVVPEPARVDSTSPARPKACRARPDNDGEIIVCGRIDNGRYRLKPLTTQYDDKSIGPGIGFDLGDGVRGNAYTTQIMSPDSKPDKRIMVTVTFPF